MADSIAPGVAVAEHGALSLAMVMVRRGMAAKAARAMQQGLGLEMPAPGRLSAADGVTVLWHGPDRILVLREGAAPGLADLLAGLVSDVAHVVDVSASRIVLTVSGDGAADALSRVLPIDLHPRVFTPGSVALTQAGHIDVLAWRAADQAAFGLACGSSYAGSFRRMLGLH